jgi:hypothetical protein
VRREERRTLTVIAGAIALAAFAPIVYLTGLIMLGAAVAPQLPSPPNRPAPQLIRDALWARANGGRATELRPINPLTLAQLAACMVQAPGNTDNERMAACTHVVPALPAVEYLSNLLLRDHGLNRQSFRGGAGAMVTTVRLSRSWSRDEFLSILAERADFGYGWRGVDAAAKGFFGKPAAALTLPEAALIASRVGDLRTDPWCEPADAVQMRNGILERMRNNDAISDTHYQDALTVALQLMPPPANSCQ